MTATDPLARGRDAFAREAWAEAYTSLCAADENVPLDPEDLERVATAAYLTGRDKPSAEAFTRAHTAFLARGDNAGAARSAFWLAFSALEQPDQQAAANGWLARMRRLLDQCPDTCAERGLWLCATGLQQIRGGEIAAAQSAFDEAARIGTARGYPDVTALARHAQGRLLLRLHKTAEGLSTLDEVMVAVTCGEVGPIVTGVVYCSVIGACQEVFDLRRAQEWTVALADWCASHPDMVPFRGSCLVRRSELLQLHGAWPESLEEARRACERLVSAEQAGAAHYQLAELLRARGEFERAEEAYRDAARSGRKPDPGLALLRLAQGQTVAAEAAIRRALEEVRSPRVRADVLRAFVEIMVEVGDIPSARSAADELARSAEETGATFLRAAAATASGAIALADGNADSALASLRTASDLWRQIDAPYEVARTRTLIGRACDERGDRDGAQMELEAAQETFERLGAMPDAAKAARQLERWTPRASGGLTGREIEVLRLIATGRSNRAIGAELGISEKTVARHVSNIFTKLDLPSRAAATAYAYEHKLL